MRRLFFTLFVMCFFTFAFSQAPVGYYNSADGLSGENLRQALYNIIKGHTVVSYKDLLEAYETTDKTSDNKVWDMYSLCTFSFSDNCGNYSNICDCYNREHSVPQSWFNEASPMKSDLFHVYPTDGKVNGYRSDYPFGECSNGVTYGKGKLGSCTFSGYTGKVFEPADEYKGDFARTYFYMATRYMDKISSWSGESFSGNNLSTWSKNLFLKWHKNDPVSQKEIDRNNVVYNSFQHNRNPYIDHPEWVEYIWGTTSGIEKASAQGVLISPNPATDVLNIKFDNNQNLTEIQIFDINLKLLKRCSAENLSIDISSLSNGCYFVKLIFDNSSVNKKFIVSK